MTDIFTVQFVINSEPSYARFEREEAARDLADCLAHQGVKAVVKDGFADAGEDYDTVYTAEPDSYPNGLYLIADTPAEAIPLAVEDGSGDRQLLRETLQDADVLDTVYVLVSQSGRVKTVVADQDYARMEANRLGAAMKSCNLQIDNPAAINTDNE